MAWPMYQRVEQQAKRLHEMMARLKIDPMALVRHRRGDGYAEARSRCLTCTTSEDCRRWLESNDGERGPPSFCPNAPLLEACGRKASRPQG
jgi:hypothetical protein